MSDVQGVYAAAITPRGNDGGIDFGASFELIDFLCKGGVDGIALFASAGEYAALELEDRSRFVHLAARRSRRPLLVGVGSATLEGSLLLARAAHDAGAAGLLLPPPYFFAYEQDDLREFYLQFSSHLGNGAATFLSQLPDGGSNLQPDTALDLLSTGRFAGIELRGAAIQRMKTPCEGSPWRILAIEDATFASSRCAGAHASVSPAACAVPELLMSLAAEIRSRNSEQAEALDRRLQEFLLWAAQFPEPAIVRTATGLRGLKTGGMAVPLSPDKQQKLEQFRSWFLDWLPDTRKLAVPG